MAIRSNCPRCGPVQLRPDEMLLVDASEPRARAHYRFSCPSCGTVIRAHAAPEVVRSLLAAGVARAEPGDHPEGEAGAPAPRHHPEEPPAGPPLTLDDLLDLLLILERDDAVALLVDTG